MNDREYFTLKNGLKCIFVKRSGFQVKYAGIGVHYGSSHKKYYRNGKFYESKSGIAHFLEHKAFIIDGHDALIDFDSMNAEANAYTSLEQTIYYFQTNDDLIPPLRLLLKMFFHKGFTKENIESEKPIILSELEEANDQVDKRIHEECLKLLYPNDPYSIEILGTKEDIENTTLLDLENAFYDFYTPKNSILTIVGDIDIEEVKRAILDEMKDITIHENNIERIPFVESISPLKPKTIYEDIPYPELHIMGRIDSLNYSMPILPNKMIALLDSIFSVEAPFYKLLKEKNYLILDDIEYSISSHEYGTYFLFDIYTNNPIELKDLITGKLKNLSIKDYDSDISNRTIKSYKSDFIRALDSISFVGDDTLSLALEGMDYEIEEDALLNTKDSDICELIPYIKNSLMTYLIALPKNVKNKK
jgi:predicted Zn-dependent peptidase